MISGHVISNDDNWATLDSELQSPFGTFKIYTRGNEFYAEIDNVEELLGIDDDLKGDRFSDALHYFSYVVTPSHAFFQLDDLPKVLLKYLDDGNVNPRVNPFIIWFERTNHNA